MRTIKTARKVNKVKRNIKTLALVILGATIVASYLVAYSEAKELIAATSEKGRWVFVNDALAATAEEKEPEQVKKALPENVGFTEGGRFYKLSDESLAAIVTAADERGLDWKVLVAIHWKETRFKCNRDGYAEGHKQPDWGCFQISHHYHPNVTWDQATDITWSSEWTADRLKRYADKYSIDEAIMRHNGSPSNPKVQAYHADVLRLIGELKTANF